MELRNYQLATSREIGGHVLAFIIVCLMPALLCQGGNSVLRATTRNIAGTVLDDRDSTPVEGAVVAIEVLGGAPVEAPATQTGSDGSFSVPISSASRYRILVQKQGFMSLSRVIAGVEALGHEQGVDMGELRLIAQCAISGRITDANDRPLTGASVQLSRINLEGLTTTITPVTVTTSNDLGEYRIFGLEPGTYYVSALFQDLADAFGLRQKTREKSSPDVATESHAVTYYPASADAESATPVRLRAGVALSNVDIRLISAQSYAVGGTVADLPPDSPAIMVRIQPLHLGSLGVSRGYTLSPGHSSFLFKSIPPGDYVVRVELQAAQRQLSARREIVVGEAPVENVVLDLHPPFSLVGHVSMTGGAAIPQKVRMSLNAIDRQFRVPITPKTDGKFQIDDVSADRYSVAVSDESGAIYVKSVALDAQPVELAEINISDPSHLLQIELSDNAGQIAGTSVDGLQHPIANGLAILLGPGAQNWRSRAAVINADGKFVFKSLAPGRYRMSCFSDLNKLADATWDVQKTVKEQGTEINIAEGDRQQLTVTAIQLDTAQ
jgi:hypothetical protein